MVLMRNGGNLTQEDTAIGANVDRSVISRCENGANIPDWLFAILLDVCGGVELINDLIEQLRSARDWLIAHQRANRLLYA